MGGAAAASIGAAAMAAMATFLANAFARATGAAAAARVRKQARVVVVPLLRKPQVAAGRGLPRRAAVSLRRRGHVRLAVRRVRRSRAHQWIAHDHHVAAMARVQSGAKAPVAVDHGAARRVAARCGVQLGAVAAKAVRAPTGIEEET